MFVHSTTPFTPNTSLVSALLDQHEQHNVTKPHHVAGFGTSGSLAFTLVILNGYCYVFITLICFILNVISIPIMLHRDIIIPSYVVLTAITLSDMFMALSSLPFNIYFYFLEAYKYFVPFDLCYAHRTFAEVVPSSLHTMSIWCTVYLAVHRYREVTTTRQSKRKLAISGGSGNRHDFITVVVHIAIVAFFSFFIQLFRFFDSEVVPVRILSTSDVPNDLFFNGTVTSPPMVSCSMRLKEFITQTIGVKAYFLVFLWSRTICIQILPCLILIFVNYLLIRVLNERIEVRKNMMKRATPKTSQDSTSVTNRTHDTLSSSPSANHNRQDVALKNWRLITRMLWLIVLITLIVELPFAAWFIYLCIDLTVFHSQTPNYVVNIVSSILNVILLLTTPLKFFIYFTMIRHFRDKLQAIHASCAARLLRCARFCGLAKVNRNASGDFKEEVTTKVTPDQHQRQFLTSRRSLSSIPECENIISPNSVADQVALSSDNQQQQDAMIESTILLAEIDKTANEKVSISLLNETDLYDVDMSVVSAGENAVLAKRKPAPLASSEYI